MLYEVACAPQDNCNTDQRAFLSVLARAYARTIALVPSANVTTAFRSILRNSATSAAMSCGSNSVCGSNWVSGDENDDGPAGVGQQLNALEVFLANLPAKALRSANSTGTATSGGSSSSNGTSGTSSSPSPSSTTSKGDAASLAASSFWLVFGAVVASALCL